MSCVYRTTGKALRAERRDHGAALITFPGGQTVEYVRPRTVRFTFVTDRVIDEVVMATVDGTVFTMTMFDEDGDQLGATKVCAILLR